MQDIGRQVLALQRGITLFPNIIGEKKRDYCPDWRFSLQKRLEKKRKAKKSKEKKSKHNTSYYDMRKWLEVNLWRMSWLSIFLAPWMILFILFGAGMKSKEEKSLCWNGYASTDWQMPESNKRNYRFIIAGNGLVANICTTDGEWYMAKITGHQKRMQKST